MNNSAVLEVRGRVRSVLVRIHRYVGLFIAGFLILSGITGAIISWDHELDEWLNPHLLTTAAEGESLVSTVLVDAIEQRFPEVQVTYFENLAEAGHAQYFWVEPRIDPRTDELFEPGFNQVYMDAVTGEILGTRQWGSFWPLSRETFVSFLYEFHYSLHIPEFWGIDHWGMWFLGAVALLWTIDCFIGFYLTLPRRIKLGTSYLSSWKPAWLINFRAGGGRLNFDLHRALGLWAWVVLFIIAFTAFSLNLYREVFYPLMSVVSDVTTTPIDVRVPTPHNAPIEAKISYAEAMSIAAKEADRRGWQKPIGSIWHAREYGVYRAEFYRPSEGHGAGGVGHEALFFDSQDGRLLGSWQPWQGTAADIFVQAQFPLHSGRILGLPGRILISVMGIVVAALSITGVFVWLRKRQSLSRRRLVIRK